MAKQKIKFYDGCKNHGKLKKETIDELWHAIEPFAAYGFNKAHAASYGIVAYQTAYMKAHYPVQYMTSVLQAESGDADKISEIVGECRRMGIDVLPPDVNESFKSFAMVSKPGEKGRIRFGLTAIKNVGDHICDVVYRERKDNGQYENLESFLERIDDKDLNKKSIESLSKAGALDSFGYDRRVLVENIENILGYARQIKEKRTSNQDSLFAGTDIALDSKVRIDDTEPVTLEQKLVWEKTLLGIYVSSHPFAYFEQFLADKVTPLNEIETCARDSWVVVGGVIDSLQKKITKKGSVMMFATLQDQTARMEMLVFPRAYEETKDIWQEGQVICVVGKTPREDGDNKIFVEKAYVLTKENVAEVSRYLSFSNTKTDTKEPENDYITIMLTPDELKQYTNDLKTVFEQYPGSVTVYVKVGMNTIRAQSQVAWGDELKSVLEQVIGEGKIVE